MSKRRRSISGCNPPVRSCDSAAQQDRAGSLTVSVGAILLLALVLRLPAMGWGLPNPLHPEVSLHPDEAYFLAWAEWLFDGRIIAKHFQYGGTLFYSLLHGCTLLADLLGMGDMHGRIVVARVASLLCSLGSLIVTYLAASTLFSRRVGVLAMLLLAVMPGHLFWSQRARPEELFALEFALNAWMMARFYRGMGSERWNLLLAGLMLGATIATRFPGGVLALGYLVVLHQRHGSAMALVRAPRLYLAVGYTVLGYVVASPHTLFYFDSFLAGLAVQWSYQSAPPVWTMGYGSVWWQYLSVVFPQSVGYPLLPLLLCGLVCALLVRDKRDLCLWVVIAAYALLLFRASWVMVRYTVPLLPLLAIIAAAGLDRFARRWLTTPSRRQGALLALVLTVGGSLVPDLAYSRALMQPSPQDRAAIWLVRHLPKGSVIAGKLEYRGDAFTLPAAASIHRWRYALHWSDLLADPRWRFLVVNREQVADIERLGEDYPDPHARQAWLLLRKQLEPVLLATFATRVNGLDPLLLFTAYDYRQFMATIDIMRRKGVSARDAR